MIAESRISSEEEAIAELQAAQAAEEAAAQAAAEEAAAQTPTFSFKGPTVGQVLDLGNKGLNDVQSGDWWSLINTAGGGYGTMAGQSSLSDMIGAGAGAIAGAGYNATNGDWTGALLNMAGGANSIGNNSGSGANSAGIDACWLNPSGAALPDGVHAEYIIRNLRECVGIALQE